MPLNYAQQKDAIEQEVKASARGNQIIQLRACVRHYQEAMTRVTGNPVDPSGDAVLVRTDIVTFLVERIAACDTKIRELTR